MVYIAQLVTATPDLKRWYIVNGDEPYAKRSSRMCVAAAGSNLEINDYRKNGTPTLSETIHESVLDAYGRAIHF